MQIYIYTQRDSTLFYGMYENFINEFDYIDDDYTLPENHYINVNNYENFKNDVGYYATQTIMENLSNKDIIKDYKYIEMQSPQFYNFTTDKLIIELDIDIEALKKYCFVDNLKDFNDYLVDNWSSRDGFISFVDTDIVEFQKEPHLDIMIDFYLINENDYIDDINTNTFELLHQNGVFYEHACVENEKTGVKYHYTVDDDAQLIIIGEAV